jgi:translation initiation factor 1
MAAAFKGIVYSTGQGRICPECGRPAGRCECGKKGGVLESDGIVRIGRETKGRKGKGVTTVRGVPLDPEALALLEKKLKKRCGAGGTVKHGVIEIQGDHRDTIEQELRGRGYTVKRSGG